MHLLLNVCDAIMHVTQERYAPQAKLVSTTYLIRMWARLSWS
jgi:hypothetical protein